MSEFFNQKSSLSGKIPSGLFNSMFGYQSGSWAKDAANTKYLGLDGYFIVMFNVHIDRYPLVLGDEVRNAVPSTWDPAALARYVLLILIIITQSLSPSPSLPPYSSPPRLAYLNTRSKKILAIFLTTINSVAVFLVFLHI